MTNNYLEVEELASDASTAMVVATLAQQAAVPTEVTDGDLYTVLNADGSITVVETPGYTDRRQDERADRPRQVKRAVTLLDVDSFIDYLARNTLLTNDNPHVGADHLHSDGSIELWADLDGRRILAILDGIDGWRHHQATLALKVSREWNEWLAVDGKLLKQADFAEFITDHLSTIASPDGALLVDICETLAGKANVNWKSQQLSRNGQRQFMFEETVEAKAGQKGNVEVPTELVLVLRPFQGSDPVPVTARFRYRLSDGQLYLGVKLAEPDLTIEQAFAAIVDDVQQMVPVRVNHGRP